MLAASEEWSLETLSETNDKTVSGSDVLDSVDERAKGSLQCSRLLIVCQSLRGRDLKSLTRAAL